jgi:hypothetical protein
VLHLGYGIGRQKENELKGQQLTTFRTTPRLAFMHACRSGLVRNLTELHIEEPYRCMEGQVLEALLSHATGLRRLVLEAALPHGLCPKFLASCLAQMSSLQELTLRRVRAPLSEVRHPGHDVPRRLSEGSCFLGVPEPSTNVYIASSQVDT